jgi:hypothetical protein
MKSFNKGETIQLWDWWAAENGRHEGREKDPQMLRGHGSLGVIVRKSRKSDPAEHGEELGSRAKNCYLVALIGEGLKSVSADWLRYPREHKK